MNTVATVTILYPPIQYSKADRGGTDDTDSI